jgi:hypothetical protein
MASLPAAATNPEGRCPCAPRCEEHLLGRGLTLQMMFDGREAVDAHDSMVRWGAPHPGRGRAGRLQGPLGRAAI